MASIIKRRDKYYSRVRFSNQREKMIPLRTDDKSVAITRNKSVCKSEQDIKSGIIVDTNAWFEWLNEEGTSEIVNVKLSQVINDHLLYQQHIKGNKQTSINRARQVLNNMLKVIRDIDIKSLRTHHITTFRTWVNDTHKGQGVHTQMARVKGFINWLYKYQKQELGLDLNDKPIVDIPKKPIKHPSYLTESDFGSLMKLESLSDFYKNVFSFYRATGCRQMEPLKGNLHNKGGRYWLIVDSEDSKTAIPREIQLTYKQYCFAKEMQENRNPNATIINYGQRFGRIFKQAIREIGRPELKFHNLRDTYAVMRWLETRDIYQVSKELGHQSVTMTEKYANIQLSRIEVDFPSICGTRNSGTQTTKSGLSPREMLFSISPHNA